VDTATLGIATLLIAAFVAANLPFFTERRMLVWARSSPKPFIWRLLELFVLYLAVGALALLIESRQGSVYPQRWEFYAITGFLFVVFAYPGFVWRYLSRGRRAA
jgi:Protein of unknown function (DUF2818)